jgi:7-dehydrocholesterol reductase
MPNQPPLQLYFAWLVLQAVLATFVPGPTGYGQLTPAGYTLEYKVNGAFFYHRQ